jgi:hypothetical protein
MSAGHRRILTYGLGEELGRDRLGRIYRAWDVRNNRPVILRLLRAAGLAPAGRVEEARSEIRRRIRAAAAVGHPNFPAILEIVPHQDLDLVVYDDVFGEPLAARIARGAPPVEALRFAIEVAAAIARAHQRGVAHGRINMANLVVARDDSVRVLDLGVPLAKEVPFLVDDVVEPGQRARNPARELERAKRQDVEALVRVIRLIMASGAADEQPTGLAGAVDEVLNHLESDARASAADVHRALVAIARKTPVGRDPSATWATTMTAAQIDALLHDRQEALEQPIPFEIEPYSDRIGTTDGSLPLMSAFDPGPVTAPPLVLPDDEMVEDEDDFELLEPAKMTGLFLPPPESARARAAAGEEPEAAESDAPPRIGPRIAAAALAIVFTIVAILSMRSVLSTASLDGALASAANAAPGLSRAQATDRVTGRPLAGPGQASGTLVVTALQAGVTVRFGDGPAIALPVTWDDVPARRHVLRVERAGHVARVDTVDVRPNLTTTRFYVLAPEVRSRQVP